MLRQVSTVIILLLAALGHLAEATAAEPKAGGGVQITNSIGMKLTLIPSGEFMMGSKESGEAVAAFFEKYYKDAVLDPSLFWSEHAYHRVRITKPFYMGTYHVTRGQFSQFMRNTSYVTRADNDAITDDIPSRPRDPRKGKTWLHPGFEQTDDHPVVCICYVDALAFCNWLSDKEGKDYRLPTEAQWEYSCRAGTTTRYYNGDDPDKLAEIGNIADAAYKKKFKDSWGSDTNDGYVYTCLMGKFKPNAFGLYDMHGNAWQWCSDYYDANYYSNSPIDDPVCKTSPNLSLNPAFHLHVLRGGGWDSAPDYARSACRRRGQPFGWSGDSGFRVVRILAAGEAP